MCQNYKIDDQGECVEDPVIQIIGPNQLKPSDLEDRTHNYGLCFCCFWDTMETVEEAERLMKVGKWERIEVPGVLREMSLSPGIYKPYVFYINHESEEENLTSGNEKGDCESDVSAQARFTHELRFLCNGSSSPTLRCRNRRGDNNSTVHVSKHIVRDHYVKMYDEALQAHRSMLETVDEEKRRIIPTYRGLCSFCFRGRYDPVARKEKLANGAWMRVMIKECTFQQRNKQWRDGNYEHYFEI